MTTDVISVIGLGYIGLPTAATLASRKKRVVGVDVNPRAVQAINRGEIHIVEPDLDMLVHAAVTEGWLRATDTPEEADAFLIAVPTPFEGDHQPDLSYIRAAARSIAPVLRRGNIVILESTSPVGATEKLAEWLAAERTDLTFPHTHGEDSDVRIAYCPERVLPGRVLQELVHNDRVIGGLTPACSEAAKDVYKLFVEGECIVTTARTAEMCKLTENSFRDVNIAFANELSVICEELKIDVWELIALANRHPRVSVLRPGPGVGGHCIAVDPWFIVANSPESARLIKTAREVNDAKPQWVADKVLGAVKNFTRKPVVACLGLAFKPDIDDLRESPAVDVVRRISDGDPGTLLIVEPNVSVLPDSLGRHQMVSFDEALERADILVLLVAHREFQGLEGVVGEHQILIAATKV